MKPRPASSLEPRIKNQVVLAVIAFLLSSPLAAADLVFPRLDIQAGRLTGFALVNPAPEDAEVTLTAFDLNGGQLAQTQLTLPAGTQVARLDSELFPLLPEGTRGWVRADSDIDQLTGFFLFLDEGLSEFDGADLPVRSRSLVFNQVRSGAGFSTEITLLNPGQQTLEAALTLVAGETALTATVQLPARGGVRAEASELFGASELPEGAFLLAEAAGDLVGFEVVGSPGGDLLALNARSRLEQLDRLYFPQVAVLGPIRSQLELLNYSDTPVTALVTAHRPDGSLYGPELERNPALVAVGGRSSARRDLAELFGFAGPRTLQGWLEVESPSPALNGEISYRIEPAGAAASVAAVAQGSRQAIFSHIATTRGFFTGIAALNPGTLAADLRIVALTRGGQRLGTFDTVLPPGMRVSRLLTEFVPGAAGRDGGLIWVSSTQPLFLTSLFGTNSGTVLANIPPQNAPDSFQPPAGRPRFRLDPPLAVLAPSAVQQFELIPDTGPLEWSVDGTPGGSDARGRIDPMGSYQAPELVTPLPVVVTTTGPNATASATVDVVQAPALLEDLGRVTALAYLPERQRLAVARLLEDGSTEVLELGPDLQVSPLALVAGEEVGALLPVRLQDREQLLLAGAGTGRLLRLDPADGTLVTLAAGLQAPRGLQLDPLTGGLLVAEAGRVSLLSRSRLESGSGPADSGGAAQRLLLVDGDLAALAVDACSGSLYLTRAPGDELLVHDRRGSGAQPVLTGRSGLGSLLTLYRRGVSCPQAPHLIAAEEGEDRLLLVRPADGQSLAWGAAPAGIPAFLPDENPFFPGAALVFAVPDGESSRLHWSDVQGLYDAEPFNPPLARLGSAGTPPGPDLSLSSFATRPGAVASVTVSYRPAPAGQPGGEGLTALAFSIGYDPAVLDLDPGDADGDGVADSVQLALADGYAVVALPRPEAGRLDLAIADFSRPFQPLPAGDLLTVHFRVLRSGTGTADVEILSTPLPSAANSQGQVRRLDETVAGTVSVLP